MNGPAKLPLWIYRQFQLIMLTSCSALPFVVMDVLQLCSHAVIGGWMLLLDSSVCGLFKWRQFELSEIWGQSVDQDNRPCDKFRPTSERIQSASVGAVPTSSADYSAGDTILETRNLSRSATGKVLVDNISIRVQQGEVLAVIGPSGAGKSSFLRLINRLDEADRS
jgi:ABC-type multidrug transport system fused ATPase/permease subunit